MGLKIQTAGDIVACKVASPIIFLFRKKTWTTIQGENYFRQEIHLNTMIILLKGVFGFFADHPSTLVRNSKYFGISPSNIT